MILVLLGTQDKPFTRLLEEIEKLINKKVIKDKVVVQAGCTKFVSENMELFDLMPVDELQELQKQADLIITHGGVGSILSNLQLNKKVIAAPRLSKYGEHTNDHQVQIINEFFKTGYLLKVEEMNELENAIKEIKIFKPKKYKSNIDNFINLIEEYIDGLK